MISLQCIWVYDYLLTLEDEVQYPSSLPKEKSDTDRRTGKLCLVWAEILGYIYLRFVKLLSLIWLLYSVRAIHCCATSLHSSYRGGLDCGVE